MKNKIWLMASMIFFFCLIFQIPVYANSSWHWVSETNPFDILPIVIVLTLVIEYFTVKFFCSLKHSIKLAIIICLANLASFLLPYTFLLLPNVVGYTFKNFIEHTPKYTIGLGYSFLTLASEIPIIFFSLRKEVKSKKNLLIAIIAVNIVTTIMVAIIERVFCSGEW